MDKIYHSDKPYYTVTSGACGLYWNPMLCERLTRRTRILLKENGQPNHTGCPFKLELMIGIEMTGNYESQSFKSFFNSPKSKEDTGLNT